MLRYVLRRLANYLLLLFIAVSAAYLMASVSLDPTNAFDWSNPSLNRQAVLQQLTTYNINPNDSALSRYGEWLRRIFFEWDWGHTPRGESINEIVGRSAWVSVRLVTIGTALGMIGGVILGAWTAVKQYSKTDRVFSFLSLLIISTPVLVLAVSLQIVATLANQKLGFNLFEFIGETGQRGDYAGAGLVDRMQHLMLPTISLALGGIAVYSRYQRNLMLDTLGSDYLRTARAKGLRKAKAIRKHALRNAIIPMATYFAFAVALVFTGAAMTETIYGWHGMGAYSVKSIQGQDINGAAAVAAFSGVCVLSGALLSDILIAIVDPRVRTS